MSTRHLIDPQLAPALDILPTFALDSEQLSAIRQAMGALHPRISLPAFEPREVFAPGRDAASDVRVLVYDPPAAERSGRAAIVHFHGGGMVLGSADMNRMTCPQIAIAHNCVIVSVDYRLAPETSFPGPQEDGYAALAWLVANAAELGVDPERIAVMGESAGGGLAAALAQMVRDRGDYSLIAQFLIYPMLDHRTGGANCPYRNPVAGEFVWTRSNNQFGWESLRGDYGCDDGRRGWFSPSLAANLEQLPPAFISVGGLDLFVDEDLDYARRLSAVGVPVELHVYPAAFHGYNLAAQARVTRQTNADLAAATARLLG